jgi:DNA-binding transcriptional MerR regulator
VGYAGPVPEAVGANQGTLLKIGEVAEVIGLSLRTIRYYEELGLIEPSTRSPGGFRLYSEDDVTRLKVLKGMKPFGLSLEEIHELMDLIDRSEAEDPGDLDALCEGLASYVERADTRVEQLVRYADEVRRLRANIAARIERLEAS